MTAIIIVAAVVLYILIGGVVGMVTNRIAENRCGCTKDSYSYCYGHGDGAFLMGSLWPVAIPGYYLAVAGYRLVTLITDVIVKED